MEVTTNYHRRDLIHGFQLSKKEREQVEQDVGLPVEEDQEYFCYRDRWYSMGEVTSMRSPWAVGHPLRMTGWDGWLSLGYGGIVVQFIEDGYAEKIIVGRY